MKILELFFIYFSKIYIRFYGDKNNNWWILPIVIISTILALNLQIVSFYFTRLNNYYLAGLFILTIIIATLLYKNIKYEDVVKYKISKRQKLGISIFIILDFVLCFIALNIVKNGKFML